MADLGDVGLAPVANSGMTRSRNPFTTSKQPTSIIVNIDDAPNEAIVILTTRSKQVNYARADSTGAKFYDLDDGDYLAYVAFDGSPGLAWSINVTGTVVTITRISTSGIVAAWTFG